ncbi:UNVERIFIED_CONTAM: hypothetical protein NY603_35335, partial [Bacteroidetes bacterium 56_B9]
GLRESFSRREKADAVRGTLIRPRLSTAPQDENSSSTEQKRACEKRATKRLLKQNPTAKARSFNM